MLCKPDVDTVLEVVMFVIVRHMVVLETSYGGKSADHCRHGDYFCNKKISERAEIRNEEKNKFR
ncbi:MAG: hypothetical protein V8R46_03870 [Eubacterium ramulus]